MKLLGLRSLSSLSSIAAISVLLIQDSHGTEVASKDKQKSLVVAGDPLLVNPMTGEESYRGISQARTLVAKQKWDEAQLVLDELELRTTHLHALTQVYRAQAFAAVARKDYRMADVAYQKLFELVLKPQAVPEELAKISSAVLRAFQTEYRSMLMMAKQPPPTAEFRAALMAAVETFGDASGLPKGEFQDGLAIEQLEMARALIKEGKRKEGLAAYEVFFARYPDFMMADGTAINTRFMWIEAHGYGRSSAERIALLQKVYSDPAFKNNSRVANIGLHLGHAYMLVRDPQEEAHWKTLIEQIEGFQKQPAKDKLVAELLQDNYQGALMQYANCLDRRDEKALLRGVVTKLEAYFADDEGGKTARRLKAKLESPSK